ncbi:MAG: competence/damage-inducible protein A [Ruminococcaceae bacterium]|nr:competence/damage-inducible protein A [Oscillospiraceae bacterium]
MVAEILCTGEELLLGDIVNTNAAFLSAELTKLGICVYYHSVVGDDSKRLKDAVTDGLSRSDIVVVSGGLGPTKDDLTKETVAELFGRKMQLHEESLEAIKAYFAKTNRVMSKNNEKQAVMPEGAIVFPNHFGTAPALALENDKGQSVIMLPGPPSELKPLFFEQVVPYIKKKSPMAIVSKNLHFFGIGESALAELLDGFLIDTSELVAATYCKEGEVRIRITAKAISEEEAERACADYAQKIIDTDAGKYLYGIDVETIENAVVKALHESGLTLSAAESCTGGLIAKRITDISGCSDVFFGGCVTYTNDVKQRLIGVCAETLEKYGAVSEQTAREMARGVRLATGSDIGISATGIAGPTGGTAETPVGTVFIGISTKNGEDFRKLSLSPMRSREYIRLASATNAFDMVLKVIRNS